MKSSSVAIVFLAEEEDPIVDAYRESGPPDVCFICRQNAVPLVGRLVKDQGIQTEHYLVLTLSELNPVAVARVFYQAYFWATNRIEAGHQILFFADIRGSQDIQVATTLASFLGLQICVVNGTSSGKLSEMGEILGLGVMRYVVDEFNVHRYDSAARMIHEIETKATTLRLRTLLKALSHLAEGYNYWQNFSYAEAKNSLRSALALLEEIEREMPIVREFRESVSMNEKFLADLLGETRGLQNLGLCLLVDMFLNALRSLETRCSLDAILRLYRCSEATMKFRLENRRTRKPKVTPKTGRQKELDLIQSYRKLLKLNDPWALKLDQNELKSIMFSRNHSLLAHGLRKIEYDEAASISEKVNVLLQSLAQHHGRKIEEIQPRAWHTVLSYELLQRIF